MTSPHDSVAHVALKIRDSIVQGEIDGALEAVRALALNGPRPLANQALQLSGRWASLLRDWRSGVVSKEHHDVGRARIADAVLALVDELEQRLSPSEAPVRPPVAATEGRDLRVPEKILGVNNLKQVAWLDRGIRSSAAVCRVLTPQGLGTGFLVGPRLMMTNNHVIPSREVAAVSKAEFNYQLPFGESTPSVSARYDLDPIASFHTDATLDYTFVAVRPPADSAAPTIESWGRLPLNADADPLPGEHVVIVQHPNGGPKQVVLTDNAVLELASPFLYYSTDTMEGSSGSPVFNDLWQVIAIHHAAGPTLLGPKGRRLSNEGVLLSAIRPRLGANWPRWGTP
jgi:V8-like Glu-specific endopeptidase